MKKLILIVMILFAIISCNSKDCNDLQSHFSNYNQAVNEVKSSNFIFEEKVKTTKSSWIKSISYYSCDSEIGFLLVETKDKEYIFKDVPINIWEEFKNADSYGKFFNNNLKGKYQLKT